MKRIVMFSVALCLCAGSAFADKYIVHTNNCNPDAMRAVLDQAARSHRAVVTKVVCDLTPGHEQQVNTVEQTVVNYSEIPVVDCVPGPIVRDDCLRCM
ncbi:MAG: hypothetical protein K5912_04375 [Alphaproteobacteria bacterium]|nr:hypothetical protein [Alphaproteobacteria bacterium]